MSSSKRNPDEGGASTPTSGTRPLRVLVVEDDSVQRDALARLLRMIGFEVTARDSVSSGVAELQTASRDLLVLDWQLGDGCALDVFAESDLPPSRLIVVTALDHSGPLPRGAALLRKPLDLKQLWKALDGAFRDLSRDDVSRLRNA